MFYILLNFNIIHIEKSKKYKDLKSNINKNKLLTPWKYETVFVYLLCNK
jgi:hypothetical protein